MVEGRTRVTIDHVQPEIDGGKYPIKRVVGETVTVRATIFVDGHDVISAELLRKRQLEKEWTVIPMRFEGNDRWVGDFNVGEVGSYLYTIRAWVDHFKTWRYDFKKRRDAEQPLEVHLQVGASLVQEASQRAAGDARKQLASFAKSLTDAKKTEQERGSIALGEELESLMQTVPDRALATEYDRHLSVTVERQKALFSTWYERFPRSCASKAGAHGTFADCVKILPEISRMGFDVWYLPPIHPIGMTNRKGKNNSPKAEKGDVGSPWAIGSADGGHKSLHPQLGTMDDFRKLLAAAKEHGIEIAMDIALQCSPDHPYIKEHPEWFRWRPDGSIQHAENPPKQYEDIVPFDFDCKEWNALWEELKSIFLFWAEQGVRIFRVDNPHTKPFPFWEWVIRESKQHCPDLIFLSEAFTRPTVMYKLAKIGFTQSYTYFTWRNTKPEFTEYIMHLLNTEVREFFRPNFWPNTPDILPEHLQFGGRPAFLMRLLLGSTLSSNYGIYGPPFELCVSEAVPGKEEYLNSEKFEITQWDWDKPGNLKDFIARVNKIRRENEALQTTWNLRFYEVDNEYLIFYGKVTPNLSNIILVVVNLDPAHVQSGWVKVPIKELGISSDQSYLVQELLTDDKYIWHGEKNFVQLDPRVSPAHIFRVRKQMKRETDFDYYF